MKKKIAIIANGWNSENLHNMMTGMHQGLKNEDVDLFVFLAHLSYSQSEDEKRSEQAIFGLPNLQDFDGAVVYGISLNFVDTMKYAYEKCRAAGIPTVSIGIQSDDTYYVGIDNKDGMKSLVEHIITEHNAKNIIYIAGDKENFDSNLRLSILRDIMAKHNLELKDEDVFYSDWETVRAGAFVEERLKNKDNIPDAIVCANDPLAMFVTYAIEEAGYSCPEDIIVTGFDYLRQGQLFYPSISTVKQDYVKIGEAVSDIFTDIFDGKEAAKNRTIQCEFIPGESCGCIGHRNDNLIRNLHSREYPRKIAYEDFKSGRMHAMGKAIMDSGSFEALPNKLQNVFYPSNGREGKTFYILMDPNFKELAYKDIKEMPTFSFADNMNVIVAKENGTPVLKTECSTEEVIPGYTETTTNHMYVLMPVYMEQYVYGYMVMTDSLEYFEDMFYLKLAKQFREDLIVYRKNLQLIELNSKLSELMQKDALTGVKNRVAYENALDRIKSDRSLGMREAFAVAMFDINNLKETNDTLGHETGDVYIKNCCKYICNSFKHSPVYRIGGDEFFVLIKGDDYADREEIFNDFREKIISLANDASLPFVERISIASGMVNVPSEYEGELDEAIKQADDLMYNNKREMKKNINI